MRTKPYLRRLKPNPVVSHVPILSLAQDHATLHPRGRDSSRYGAGAPVARPQLAPVRRLRANKLNTRMLRWYRTALYRSIVAVSEHHGGRVSNVSSQHVAATATYNSYSYTAVDIFHFRLVTLASKWVQQSWRAERLMENGAGGVLDSLGVTVVVVVWLGERRCGVRALTRSCHVREAGMRCWIGLMQG